MRNILLLLVVLLLCQCRVREIPTTATQTFSNATGQRIVVDRYSSREDYRDVKNRLSRDTLEPGAAKNLPLEAGTTLWLDWYSLDYSVNNWMHRPYHSVGAVIPQAEYVTSAENQSISFQSSRDERDTSRSVLLNGNEPSSTWELQLATDTGAFERGTHQLIFRKDFTGIHSTTYLTGGTRIEPFRFVIYPGVTSPTTRPPVFTAYVYLGDEGDVAMSVGMEFYAVTRDSLMADLIAADGGGGMKCFIVRK